MAIEDPISPKLIEKVACQGLLSHLALEIFHLILGVAV